MNQESYTLHDDWTTLQEFGTLGGLVLMSRLTNCCGHMTRKSRGGRLAGARIYRTYGAHNFGCLSLSHGHRCALTMGYGYDAPQVLSNIIGFML